MRSKSGPGGTLYHYGFCELAQRQAVLLRKDKLSNRAIKSDRAKVVMTAGCIRRTAYRQITMIRQQPEGHDTFASGDSCFCAAKVAPVALYTIPASVNWLSDKRY